MSKSANDVAADLAGPRPSRTSAALWIVVFGPLYFIARGQWRYATYYIALAAVYATARAMAWI
ncbi:MAG: hypothetical protein NW223_06275 [Hyphomicrobiaceae bacterium]|nr:hypothetical protein [Hyphomicrobiaceae bacterium]